MNEKLRIDMDKKESKGKSKKIFFQLWKSLGRVSDLGAHHKANIINYFFFNSVKIFFLIFLKVQSKYSFSNIFLSNNSCGIQIIIF